MKSPFDDAKLVLETLQNEGFEAYFVGGAVRDYLLERTIGDVDIATSARPEEVQKIFKQTVDVGAEHGTIIVLHRGTPYEITTFRAESEYENFRRPKEVAYITSLKEDLKRRDFTINAMAMDSNGMILDYFNGKDHLKDKLIQTVGLPFDRFNEDALRMLRAVRFVSQLNFNLCPLTKEAMSVNSSFLSNISVERKTVEFEKLLKGSNQKRALELIVETKINEYLPGLQEKQKELLQLSNLNLKLLKSTEELWTIVTYFMAPNSVESFLRKWKLPVKTIRSAEKYLHFLTKVKDLPWNDLLLYEAGFPGAVSVERLRSVLMDPEYVKTNVSNITKAFRSLPLQHREELEVNGHDIISIMNQKPGPWVSRLISQIEKEIINENIPNEKSAIKEWLIRCKQDFDRNC